MIRNRPFILIIAVLLVSVVVLALLTTFSKKSKEEKRTALPTPKVKQEREHTSLAAFASKPEVATGETFSITIAMSTRDNLVTGVQLELSYDPSVITVTAVSPGNFFAKPVEYANKIDPKKGEVTYAIGSFDGKKGSGTVAKIEATARKKTEKLTEIVTIKNTSLVTELNNKTSVLKDMKGAFLVIR